MAKTETITLELGLYGTVNIYGVPKEPINLENFFLAMDWTHSDTSRMDQFVFEIINKDGTVAQFKDSGYSLHPVDAWGFRNIQIFEEGTFTFKTTLLRGNGGTSTVKQCDIKIVSNEDLIIDGPVRLFEGTEQRYTMKRSSGGNAQILNPKWIVEDSSILEIIAIGEKSIIVKALKIGSTNVKLTGKNILGTDVESNRTITVSEDVEIAIDDMIICSGSFTTASIIKGATKGQEIVWSSPNLIVESGQGSKNAVFRAGNSYNAYTKIMVNVGGVVKEINGIWVGKPYIEDTRLSYDINDRVSLITLAVDKKKIKGPYDKLEWVYPSNTSEYEVTKGENDNELIFKTKLKANQTGQAVFKCVASNSCGDAETTHTINISEVDGTSFNKPIGLGILHSLKSVLNISEEAQYFFHGIGNPESKIYFSFELIEDYSSVILNSYLRDLEGNSREVVLYVYDSNKNLIFTRDKLESPAGDTIKIGIGKYYIVADVIDGNGMIDMNLEYIPGGVGFSGAISVPIDQNGFYFSDFHDTTAYAYHNIIREYSNGGEIFYKVEMPKYAQELDIRVHTLGSLGFQCIHLAHYDENIKEYEILETVMTNPAVDMSVFERYTGYDNMLRRTLHPGEVVYIIVECRKNSNQSKDRGPICITIDGWGNRHHPESTDSITVNKASAPEMSEMALLDIDDRLNYVEDTSRTDYYNLYNFQEKDGYWRSLSNAKEAYHNIEITKPLDLIVHHDGSKISNTYIHIVSLKDFNHAIDIGKPMISVRGEDCDYTNPNIPATLKRGQAFVEVKNIQPGKYCIISQGVNMKDNGIIKVNIEAKHPTK